ncbi:hypothetical protein T265_06486 [Opisthorchis viverrini]|uniref:Uncharacterized protein n=1 Tax=Opisthorchis viverrini TaxID=6198 RepID=A0A074ZG84_OPIVI|nr:hypothetical protein T265_06486 [Opisthorchis viverrini]KER26203.1 hypothetical protein T265_06486 [Opisthorchis viverrini]
MFLHHIALQASNNPIKSLKQHARQFSGGEEESQFEDTYAAFEIRTVEIQSAVHHAIINISFFHKI